MKKITTILMLLMLTCMGAWAEELTLSNGIKNSGTMKNVAGGSVTGLGCTFTSNTTPVVTIKSFKSGEAANVMNLGNGYFIADPSSDFEISLPDGYVIQSFTYNIKNNKASATETFSSTSGTVSQSNVTTTATDITVSDINAQSATFNLTSTESWNTNTVSSIKIVYSIADYTNNVETNILPWIESIDNGYFTLDPTNTAVQALQTAYTSHTGDTWTEDEYNDLLALLTAAKNAKAYIMPETGYYRLKANTVSGRPEGYIGYSQTTLPNYSDRGVGLRNIAIADAATDASTILKLTEVEGGYTISTEGLYVMDQETQGQLFPVTDVAENAAVFVLTIHETVPGKAFFGTATNSKNWGFHNSNWNAIVGWTNSEPSYWILEDATTLTLPLTNIDGKYYATTCLPFPVKLSEAAAYKVTLSGKKAVEELIGDVIPANIPVLLISDASATLTATIQETTATVDCGDLKGVCVKTAKADLQGETPVVLNQSDGKVGFYKLADGSSLSANRAYLSYVEGTTSPSSKAFFEEGFELGGNEATAIENIENGAFDNGAVYNLQGQRVTKAQKGVYIINNKKVVVK